LPSTQRVTSASSSFSRVRPSRCGWKA